MHPHPSRCACHLPPSTEEGLAGASTAPIPSTMLNKSFFILNSLFSIFNIGIGTKPVEAAEIMHIVPSPQPPIPSPSKAGGRPRMGWLAFACHLSDGFIILVFFVKGLKVNRAFAPNGC